MKAHKVNIIFFITLVLGLGSLNLLVDNASGETAFENRTLQSRPTFTLEKLLSGELFRRYDQYVADHFVFREAFIGLAARVETMKRIPGEEQVQIVTHQGANTAQRALPAEIETPDPAKTGLGPENQAAGAKQEETATAEETLVSDQAFGRILIYGDQAMEIHRHNPAAVTAYAQALNSFRERMPQQQMYTMQVPTAIQFMDHGQYRELSDHQSVTIAALEKQLHPSIHSIDTIATLSQHRGEDLFFRTDHHWTARGAYYAYAAFMEQTGRTPLPFAAFDREVVSGFLGSLYGATRSEALARSPDTMEIFLPPVSADYRIHLQNAANQVISGQLIDLSRATGDQPYSVFLGGDYPLAVITNTQAAGDHSILVVKDSYANALVPFLVAHYQEVHVIDPRMYTGRLADYTESRAIDEVLFLNYVLVHRYEGYVELLEALK